MTVEKQHFLLYDAVISGSLERC